MTSTLEQSTDLRASPKRGWIEDWEPEDAEFWEATGKTVARRNLVFSIFAEHVGFSVWLLWSVSAALLAGAGFDFTAQQLFWLVAVPNLVGALLRLPYTFAVPRFGGRNWTVISGLLLLIPTLLFAHFVQRPETPYWVFVVIAATAGFGGGNFASSMASLNFFYPAAKKGAALGLNAAGGNAGVAVIQFFLPVVVGGAGAFGLVQASEHGIVLERAGHLYAALALLAAVCAFCFMDNLRAAYSTPREQLAVVRQRHTWVMALIYIGTFGSFIGYSAAMPLLIKVNFWHQSDPADSGIGINFVHYAFLGALVGSLARPAGGWLADRYGGARVTLVSFLAMALGTLGVLLTLTQLQPVPASGTPDQIRAVVDANAALFGWFLAAFVFVFAASGVGNGSAYRMIPAIWRAQASSAGSPGSTERMLAEVKAPRESSAALGIVGAVGALGGFLIPLAFAAPWIGDPVEAVRSALLVFAGFYVVCCAVTYAVYLRPGTLMGEAGV